MLPFLCCTRPLLHLPARPPLFSAKHNPSGAGPISTLPPAPRRPPLHTASRRRPGPTHLRVPPLELFRPAPPLTPPLPPPRMTNALVRPVHAPGAHTDVKRAANMAYHDAFMEQLGGAALFSRPRLEVSAALAARRTTSASAPLLLPPRTPSSRARTQTAFYTPPRHPARTAAKVPCLSSRE